MMSSVERQPFYIGCIVVIIQSVPFIASEYAIAVHPARQWEIYVICQSLTQYPAHADYIFALLYPNWNVSCWRKKSRPTKRNMSVNYIVITIRRILFRYSFMVVLWWSEQWRWEGRSILKGFIVANSLRWYHGNTGPMPNYWPLSSPFPLIPLSPIGCFGIRLDTSDACLLSFPFESHEAYFKDVLRTCGTLHLAWWWRCDNMEAPFIWLGPVLLTLLRHVARILANGSAAFCVKAAMPLAEILVTCRKNVSNTGLWPFVMEMHQSPIDIQ